MVSGAEDARDMRRTIRNRSIFAAIVVLACAAVTVGVFVGQGSDQHGPGLTKALGLEGRASTGHVRMAIAHDLGLNAGNVVHRASVTDPQVIARVTTQLDHLGPAPNGPIACPKDDGETFVLTFTRRDGPTSAATARLHAQGCRFVGLSLEGHTTAMYQGTPELANYLTRLDP
jgi:hypothetical protein